ncbi:hypothetical protein H4R26_002676 [Coemansia thaxteri]|uniref:PP1-binding domain-containing protein n=1 Tax=Coemansia thaxteri TaxID=2663907 RepID=A0A9W8BEF8_9FUNG|nr:hypothetical protein H4R26_002676 [Coemansia thaxteri]
MRNRSLDASPGVGGLSSPLKRTLSSSQPRPVATRLPPLPPSFVSALAVGGPADETQEEEEVPTEPEPETESDRETDSVPALGPTTPEPRRGQRPRLMQEASAARKSVRFGPALSPEVFDAQAPPATPLRRGTPIQMARASSILRRTSPTRATMASPSLLRSLLTPRPTRRQAMHSYLATLAKQDPSPPPTERCAVVADTDQLKNVGVLSSAQAIDPDQIMVAKPEITAVDIESPTALGASPADRRRRRSVRLNARRVSLDSPSRVAGGGGGSPSRLVSCSVARRPPAAAALASQRHHRRRTAPAGGIAAESLALLAAALGEDVPRLAAAPKAAEAVEEKETEEPSEWETDGADGVPDLGCGLPASPALGLADAMQGAEREADQPITSEPLFESSLSLSSSDLVLREQAERQARISGADDCEWAAARLAGLSVASPADPQQPEGSSARQQQRRRRQTIDGLVAPLSTSLLEGAEDGADGALALASADDILAHRQRLRRLQERRHRRQTLAALNKRRSSWRGWMPRAVMTMSSPPSSPEPADHVAHCATPPSLPALHGSRSPHVTGHSHAAMQHALSALLPAAIAAGGGQEGNPVSSAYSAPSSSFISADSMYPPAAWNNGEPSTAGGSSARRRITDIVVSALGMGHAKEPMAAEPAVSASSPAFAYPPRPVPIDAEWETIEHADQTVATPPLQQDAESRKDAVFASENDEAMSQQVELFAVSQPEQFDGVGAFAEMPPAPNSSGVASLDAASKEATRPPSPTIASPAAVASPDASVSTPDPSVVFSPPTTRGRTRCQNLPPATKPAPSAATVDTKPSVGRRRAPLAAPAAPEVPAAAVPRTTRKRRADGPPPTIVPAPATKRGRGRPPATSVVRGGQRAAEPSSVKPPVSVISPPATRMTVSFTYVKESYFLNKKTLVYHGMLESSSQTSDLEPVWSMHVTDHEASLSTGRNGSVIMTAAMDSARKDRAQFAYQGKMTNGGFDGTRSTWAFHDFEGHRYDWVAGIMQNCWKLEDSEGKTVAQYIGMARDYKVRGTLSFMTKVNESLISLVLLTTKLINYDVATK